MGVRVPGWFPRLSRWVWAAVGILWLAISAILWFVVPIQPSMTITTGFPVVPIGFADSSRKLLTLDGHCEGDAFSGQEIADAGPVRWWDLASGRNDAVMPGSWGQQVYGVDIAPDGRAIAFCGGFDGTLLVGVPSGEQLKHERWHDVPKLEQFSASGAWYFMPEGRRKLRAINVSNRQTWERPLAESEYCLAIAFASNDELLAIGIKDDNLNRVECWDLANHRLLWTALAGSLAVAFSPNGRLLAVLDEEGSSGRVLLARTGEFVQQFTAPDRAMDELHFSHHNLLTGVRRFHGAVRGSGRAMPLEGITTWNVDTGERILDLNEKDGAFLSENAERVGVSAQPLRSLRVLVNVQKDGRTTLVRLEDGQEVWHAENHPTVLQVSYSGRFVVLDRSPFTESSWRRWLTAHAHHLGLRATIEPRRTVLDVAGCGRTILLPDKACLPLFFSEDGKKLVAQRHDGMALYVYDLPARPTLSQLLLWSLPPNALVFLIAWGWCAWRRRRVT